MKIKCGLFQGESRSSLPFVLLMTRLTLVIKQAKAFYEVKKGGKKINHFWNNLKLFAKNEDQIHSLVNAVRSFSGDIKMECGLPKCRMLIMKRGKVVKSKGISMPNGKRMKNIEEGRYKHLGIVEVNCVKYEEMKV